MKNIGELYYKGHEDFKKDIKKSIRAYQQSAYAYDISASLNLIKMYSSLNNKKALEICKEVSENFKIPPPTILEKSQLQEIEDLLKELEKNKEKE